MDMSQGFRWKYDEMQEGDPTKETAGSGSGIAEENYSVISHARNICFVLPDGNRIFLNYGYLVSGEYLPEDNKIILSFTSHTITLAGIYLEKLFYDLMQGLPRQLVCTDTRYNTADETNKPIVNGIQVIETTK
jgi:hypothetical protein